MHVLSLVKIPWHLHKLLSGNKNMVMSWADNSVKIRRNLAISNPKPNLTIYQVWWKSIDVYTSYHLETKYGWTYHWWTDGLTHWRPTWNHNTPPPSCGGVEKRKKQQQKNSMSQCTGLPRIYICGERRLRSACASLLSNQGLCSALYE